MMNSETFLTNFGHIANAPNGVAVLRETVLTLAMQGKLVKQNTKDIPVIELLKEVEAEKQRLAEEQKIKLPKQLFDISEEEKLYPIPDNWEWVRFGTIALHNSGKTLDKQRNKGQFRDYITTSNLYWGKFDLRNLRQMLIKDEELERCTAKKGDLLICEGGEAGRAAVWPHDYEVSFQNHVHRARFYCDINPFFAYRFFEKLNSTGEIDQYRKGVGISSMSGKVLASIVLPLPPVAEQKLIVTKVDELMALCDQLEAQQKERERHFPVLSHICHTSFAEAPTPANLNRIFDETGIISPDDLRKTILTLAVQGKLVTQNSKDEPASILIAHILAEKRRLVSEKKIRQQDDAAPIAKHELPFTVPQGWAWARLSSLTRRIQYGFTAPSKMHIKDVRLLRITDIQNNSVKWKSVPGCEIAKEDIAQYKLERGDILVARTGGTVGKTYLITDMPVVAVFASYLIRIQSGIGLSDWYLKLFLESPTYWVQLEKGARGGAQPNVNGRTLGRMVVPVPPFSEQLRIVTKVNELMVLVDYLETQQRESDKLAEDYAKACVASFTGTNIERKEIMKVPKTELVSVLTLGKKAKPNTDAPLATLLSMHKGELPAKTLWQQSGLVIDVFYQQLKIEIAQGWIAPPAEAEMKVLEEA